MSQSKIKSLLQSLREPTDGADERIADGTASREFCRALEYHNCNISGQHEYRITGTRGSVPHISFGTQAGTYEEHGEMWPTGQLNSSEMEINPDGTFEILVSKEKKPGNWLPTKEESGMLFRWIESGGDHPPVRTRVVPLSELSASSQ